MKKEAYRGITFVQALFLLFLGLKLAGAIDWTWWAVFAPLVVGLFALIIEAWPAS